MAWCHDGWLGGSFYGGGGFPGLAKFDAMKFDAEVDPLISVIKPWEEDLEYVKRPNEGEFMESVPNLLEGQGDAVVYMVEPIRGDSFRHFLITPEVWKELRKVLGRKMPERQYGYAI